MLSTVLPRFRGPHPTVACTAGVSEMAAHARLCKNIPQQAIAQMDKNLQRNPYSFGLSIGQKRADAFELVVPSKDS